MYSPYVQAFVKTSDGVFDLSPYIVSGSINRKVNQVSSAQLSIRNPVIANSGNLLFTEYPRSDGIGPLIHPMDPIAITMTRIQGFPVQVFTGYVDKSPYFQLYPGICTIEASCTLKRLLYTQWDAALPFVEYFLQSFGWLPGTQGISNPTADQAHLAVKAGAVQGDFNDGSIGALLFAVLKYIGLWDASNIFIEALPNEILTLVTNLYHSIQDDVKPGEELFQTFLSQILGTSAQGSGSPAGSGGSSGGSGSAGGTASGPVQGAQKIVQTVEPIAQKYNIPLLLVLATMYIETGFTNVDSNSSYLGWFQQSSSHPPYSYGTNASHTPSFAEAHDLGLATTAFCSAAVGYANANPSLRNDIHTWAEVTQGVQQSIAQGGNQYYLTGWPAAIATGQSYISKFGGTTGATGNASQTATISGSNLRGGGTGPGGSSLSPTSSATTASSSSTSSQSGTSPGGKKGNANASSSGAAVYFPPIPHPGGLARTDEGVDYSGAGSTVYAIGDATVVSWAPSGFEGVVFIYQLTTGDHSGMQIYCNEGINISTQYRTQGAKLTGGQPIGTIQDQGTVAGASIEIGFWEAGHPYKNTDAADGQPYSTSAGRDGRPTVGGWEFTNFMKSIGQTTRDTAPPGFGGGSTSGSGTSTGSASSGGSGSNSSGGTTGGLNPSAAAFSTFINLPSIFSLGEALAFTGKRSFMADQPLFPFVAQLCQASMRNFMSMPNGNFFAFFPDYFGIFGRKYYWEINDIEIMDARIDLTDDPLATHVAVVGDVTNYGSQADITVFDKLQTSGIFSIFDAFTTGYIGNVAEPQLDIRNPSTNAKLTKKQTKTTSAASTANALAFLEKFGARPLVQEIPAIRNPFFELFYAFQTFMLLWSKQFETAFELTFMPEIFPGGLVALPQHHLQLYVEEVIHYFDYAQGFTTTISVSSPSQLDSLSRPNISVGLARDIAAVNAVTAGVNAGLNAAASVKGGATRTAGTT